MVYGLTRDHKAFLGTLSNALYRHEGVRVEGRHVNLGWPGLAWSTCLQRRVNSSPKQICGL